MMLTNFSKESNCPKEIENQLVAAKKTQKRDQQENNPKNNKVARPRKSLKNSSRNLDFELLKEL